MKKKILWAANSYWNSPFQVGANNLAREFLKDGWHILFISDPISPFHLLRRGSKSDIADRFETWRRGGEEAWDGQLIYYSPFTLLPPYDKPFLKSEAVLENWHRLAFPNIKKKVKNFGFAEVDLLIIDSVTQHFWIDTIKSETTVVRITDNFAAFEKISAAAMKKEKELISRADHVLFTSKCLEEHVLTNGARQCTYVPNGVNLEKFNTIGKTLPAEYENIPEPRVIYVGAIEKWFDTDLMAHLATQLPEVSFVIIGPVRASLKSLEKFKNIYILGKRDSDTIGQYMANAKVGIIPFDASDAVVDSIHPLKLYEYLACELSVVTIDWRELEEIDAPFYRAKNKDEFLSAVQLALNETFNRTDLKKFDWNSRYNSVKNVLQLNGEGAVVNGLKPRLDSQIIIDQ
ncbi:MAG: glycosyltransferase [Calditrichaeota bacterium]|nr:MAG: glycosyltransferase [Calditrichota bacterium]